MCNADGEKGRGRGRKGGDDFLGKLQRRFRLENIRKKRKKEKVKKTLAESGKKEENKKDMEN